MWSVQKRLITVTWCSWPLLECWQQQWNLFAHLWRHKCQVTWRLWSLNYRIIQSMPLVTYPVFDQLSNLWSLIQHLSGHWSLIQSLVTYPWEVVNAVIYLHSTVSWKPCNDDHTFSSYPHKNIWLRRLVNLAGLLVLTLLHSTFTALVQFLALCRYTNTINTANCIVFVTTFYSNWASIIL